MSPIHRDDRPALIALGLILAAIVLLAFFETGTRYPFNDEISQAESSQVEKDPESNIPRAVASADDFDFWNDPFPQWVMAVFAVLATAVSMLAVKWVRDTLEATRDGNRNARESSEQQLRAYIDVRPGSVKDADASGDAMGFVSIKNVGQIPATEVRTLVRIAAGAKDRTSFDQEDAIHTIGSLQPGAAIKQGTEPEGWANLVDENEFIFVFGVVNYIDGFKRERITKFCHRYRCADIASTWSAAAYAFRKEVSEARQHHTGNDVT